MSTKFYFVDLLFSVTTTMPFVPQAPLVHDPQEAEWFDPAGLLSRLKDLRAHVAGAEMSELAEARDYFVDRSLESQQQQQQK